MSSTVTGARRFPAPPGQQHRGRLAGLLRGPEHDPWWARPGLLGLLLATAILYTAGLSRNGWANDFYSAAVQAGATSWKAFFFGSFDSSSFITVDKTPASLWVMELSVRLFGLNSWSVLLPQAAEGVAAVGILYAAVRRWSGPAAGLIAAGALAAVPVATLMFRFNNPDALLVLLMTAAAYALVRAIESGRTRWLVLAGALLGAGFLTKMLQAFLVLPGFALVYLVAGPPRLLRRCGQLLAGGAALLVAAGWWVAIVMLTPAAARPYVGGSTNDSILQLALGYNGLGRLDGNETGSVGPGAGHGGSAAFSGAAGLTRLFAADMGGQISWLLPAALISLAGLLWLTWRRPRTDRLRAAALLWGGWLLVTGLVFSYMNGIIHPYYTVALAPAIAALVGVGAVVAWRARSALGVRLVLAAAVLVTTWWAYSLLDRSASWLPGLRVLVVACGLAAAAVIVAERWVGGPDRTVLAAVLPLALVSGLAGPLAYSLDTAATGHTGALPSAGPSVVSSGGPGGGFGSGRHGGGLGSARPGAGFGGQAGPGGGTGGPGGLAGDTQVSSAIIKLLVSGAGGYRWAAATVGAESAAPFQLASREPIMAIGGFNGTDTAPSLAEFKTMVAGHEIHYFIAANRNTFGGGAAGAEAITTWVTTHFSKETVGGETVYNLTRPASS